jgi:hypothetical protein
LDKINGPSLAKPTYPSTLDRLRELYNISRGDNRRNTEEAFLKRIERTLSDRTKGPQRLWIRDNFVEDAIKSLQEYLPEPVTIEGIKISKKGVCVSSAVWSTIYRYYPAANIQFKHRAIGHSGVVMFTEDFIYMVGMLKKSFKECLFSGQEKDEITIINGISFDF